jgi:hypothetical protein
VCYDEERKNHAWWGHLYGHRDHCHHRWQQQIPNYGRDTYTFAESTPAGMIETTIGILILAIGMFIAIHGFGQLEENRKVH